MDDPNTPAKRPPRSEWVVALCGLVILLGVLGVLVYEILNGGETPPNVTPKVLSISRSNGGYLVQVAVANGSGETTAGLTLEGTLVRRGQGVETSEATLAYVPGGSVRRAGLFFTENPSEYQLELRTFGYQEP